ncbi:DUF6524 family protein [Azospirillum sp. TSO35-2]|uniref:DUF6524 family protein n=1 Tax=Azospirillum sp. TSO35-2 TaxID=716796 RepID=UPI000D61F987|nr:DUF6524 family protein [Azospirillum sp. TSO35-2]PWC31253.1 hypothetical protein TSO352_31165 [Azospirillum sp. TSO35-2]
MKSFGFFIRALSCFLLLFATWNPSGYSYLSWLDTDDGSRLSLKLAVGVLLLATYAAYARIAWVALRWIGTLTCLALLISGYLAIRHFGLLDPNAPFWNSAVVLIFSSVVLSVGVCWSHIKRRISGQSHVLSPPP